MLHRLTLTSTEPTLQGFSVPSYRWPDTYPFSSDLILIKIFLSKIRTVIEERLNALCFVEILEAYSENSRLSLNYEPTTSPNSASTKRRAS